MNPDESLLILLVKTKTPKGKMEEMKPEGFCGKSGATIYQRGVFIV